jgi:hypothetical protein
MASQAFAVTEMIPLTAGQRECCAFDLGAYR